MRKIYEMHRRFGRRGHGKCGECKHFKRGRYHDMMLQKCEIYGMTHSEATDWAQKWEACGQYNEPYKGPAIIGVLRHAPRGPRDPEDNQPLPGQMDLFGEDADAEITRE